MADLEHLKMFALAVEKRGMAAAGRELGVPASTVGRAIDRLENGIGVALLHRSSRGVTPTEAGQVYYEGVRKVFIEIEALGEQVRSLASGLSGQLRVTLPVMQDVPPLLERCIGEFSERYPSLVVDTVATNRSIALAEEGFDVGFRNGPIKDQSLRARRLFDVEWCLLASVEYLKTVPAVNTVEQVLGLRSLAFGEGPQALKWPLVKGGSVTITPAQRSNNFALLKRSLLCGSGVAFVPKPLFHREIGKGRVAVVAPDLIGRTRSFYVVHPLARPLPEKTRAFVEFAVAFFEAIEFP